MDMSRIISELDLLLSIDFSKIGIIGERSIYPSRDNNGFEIKITDKKALYPPDSNLSTSHTNI